MEIHNKLNYIPSEGLKILDSVLDEIKDAIEDALATHERRKKYSERQKQRQRTIHQAAQIIFYRLNEERTLDQAVRMTAKETGLETATCKAAFHRARLMLEQHERENRDRKIMVFYRKGYTNDEIAQRVKLSKGRVANIISTYKKL